MNLIRNVLAIALLITIIWITFLLISYVTSITILYTLEQFPENILLSVFRVVTGALTAGAWIVGWYKLTKLWLYRILLSRRRET